MQMGHLLHSRAQPTRSWPPHGARTPTTYPDEVRTRPLVAVALLVAAGLMAACTSSPTATPTSAAPTSASPTSTPSIAPTAPTSTPAPASPTPSPTPTAAPEYRSPLDGEPAKGARPVLVVKLDNTTYAQPHAGLSKADLVYIEEVEYGITRLAAVFSSHVPTRIGPVRSARITDVDLLAQYDRPAFAFSGAQRRLLPTLAAAPFYDVSPNKGGEGYSRDYRRNAPYNLYLDGQVALNRAPDASLAQDMGFMFDIDVPAGGVTATAADMSWSYGKAGFRYDPKSGLYRVLLNGRPAAAEESKKGQRASTVVLQSVKQTPSRYFDKAGGNTPHAETIGSGTAWVLRDGLAWKATWSRPTEAGGTTFTLSDGSVMAFKPGQVWVVLLDSKRKASVRPLTEPPSPVTSSPTAQ